MPKLLRAVRLDDSDEHVFRACGAAQDGEWVVSGGYAVCDFNAALWAAFGAVTARLWGALRDQSIKALAMAS